MKRLLAARQQPANIHALLPTVLNQAEVRDPDPVHANIMIWGTLEARVQGAELVILAGLNEGVWPARAPPDPWLNRAMRFDAGLLLPERRIGLAAHDFQQAIAAQEVWLTRSVRDDDEETVPSRWINRLTNLLNGLPDQGGDVAMSRMTDAAEWLAMAEGTGSAKARPQDGARVSAEPSAAGQYVDRDSFRSLRSERSFAILMPSTRESSAASKARSAEKKPRCTA